LEKTIFGGYKNPAENLAHQSQYSDLYKSSQYCVTCHDSLPHSGKSSNMPRTPRPRKMEKRVSPVICLRHSGSRPMGNEIVKSPTIVSRADLEKSVRRPSSWISRLK
jgi:hypothetical protein